MTIAAPAAATTGIARDRTETGFRRVFLVFAIIAALGILFHFVLLIWAQNGLTGPECVVTAQAMMLAHDGSLYYDLKHYPFTVCAYMPLFYALQAGLYMLGLPAYVAGRLISFLAMLGIVVLSWKIVLLYTRDRNCAWTAVLLTASSSLLLCWGTVGQVDTMAAMFAVAAFYQYSRWAIRAERTLLWATAFALLAFFTKQTMIACPAAIFVLLWFHDRKTAFRFGAGLAAIIAILVLLMNTVTDGRFLSNTVFANLNPYSLTKLLQHLKFAFLASGPLMLIAGAGTGKVCRTAGRALFVYLGTALAIFMLIASKTGSDLNYQIEPTILLILCACVALHSLDFFHLSFQGTKTWITLLQLPLAVFLVVNCGIRARDGIVRAATEQMERAEIERLRPVLSAGGMVLSADYNAMTRLRGRLDVEMLIYKLLVDAGVVNPEPVRQDIAAAKFSAILLMEDVNRPDQSLGAEISTLPQTQLDEVRRRYVLAARDPMGVYVYKPKEVEAK